ncbi:hypothetical protein [Streptomyces beigongshangae]|uniref:hypothetical protein n=1 Tax=Streptomyces beigongshangae TaxID=2841597 RepID=UPI001C85FDDA|nr:hypothetical protein [Streptomyces sp. REN17]
MNGLISELVAAGEPMQDALLLILLILLIRAIAAAIAKIAEALHPGESSDAVAMQVNRIQHRQWKAQRRDWNRRARASRRAIVWAGLRTWHQQHRTARYIDGQIVLPALVIPPDEPLSLPTP